MEPVIQKFETQEEWFQARIGRPTASCADKILTPATLKLSAQRHGYANQLIGERITGTPDPDLKLDHIKSIKQGNEREPDAISEYMFQTDREVDAGHIIIVSADGQCTCSPDAMVVGDEVGVEAKCPNRGTHIGYLRDGVLPTKYRLQLAKSLLVSGYKRWDFISYHPEIRPLIVRVTPRDLEKEIQALEAALKKFCADLDAAEKDLLGTPLEAVEPTAAGLFG